MIYTFTEKDENATSGSRTIEIPPERWAWGVVYTDGTELKQFGDDGQFHQFREIDQGKVEMFVMYKLEDPDKRIDMVVAGKQIFHIYRITVLNANTPHERKSKVYVFGWRDPETRSTHYNYILPDDRIVVADRDIEITKFNL